MTHLLYAVAALLAAGLIYVLAVMGWAQYRAYGDRYFSRPLAERRRHIETLQKHARYVRPVFEALAKVAQLKKVPVMRYGEVTGPPFGCTKKSYAFTKHYRPQPNDIFIATQMKCGTTWMQQIVFEILHGGDGDLSDSGYRHMYALSPWIETSPKASVAMENAPLVGPGRNRIIKTHMPADLTPYAEAAKYIYVTRHPVSCFASCVDFIGKLGGPLIPDRTHMLAWFCSEDMWWRPWPDHVEGWWRRAQAHDNVLFVHYEEMKRDLRGAIRDVAEFLQRPLSAEELDKVAYKASFEYMRDHEYYFEMFAPTIFSVSGPIRFMQAGTVNRYQDTRDAERERINAFCRERLKNATYPLAKYYPDVAGASDQAGPQAQAI